jgi:DNA polymerase III delta prime subunit
LFFLADPNLHRPKYLKANFKKPGPDGLGSFRCILVSGPPGIGKTTSAHLVAKLQGYDILELNASDTRSKKLLEVRSSLSSLFPLLFSILACVADTTLLSHL